MNCGKSFENELKNVTKQTTFSLGILSSVRVLQFGATDNFRSAA